MSSSSVLKYSPKVPFGDNEGGLLIVLFVVPGYHYDVMGGGSWEFPLWGACSWSNPEITIIFDIFGIFIKLQPKLKRWWGGGKEEGGRWNRQILQGQIILSLFDTSFLVVLKGCQYICVDPNVHLVDIILVMDSAFKFT